MLSCRTHGLFLVGALGLLGCRDPAAPKSIKRPLPEQRSPKIIHEAEIHSITPTSAQFSLTIDQDALAFLVVSDDFSLQLTSGQLIRGRIDAQQYTFAMRSQLLRRQSTPLTLRSLKPDTSYQVHYALAANEGNSPSYTLRFTTPPQPDIPASSIVPIAKAGQPFSFRPSDDPTVNVEVLRKPQWMSLNTDTMTLSGVVPLHAQDSEELLIYRLNVTHGSERFQKYITIQGDPLSPYSLALENKGQKAFAFLPGSPAPTPSARHPIPGQHQANGHGISLRILGDKIQADHPEWGGRLSLPDPASPLGTNIPPGSSGSISTSIAGIIAAEGWNGIGSRGLVPLASLSHWFINYADVANGIGTVEMGTRSASDSVIVHGFLTQTDSGPTRTALSSLYQTTLRSKLINGRGGRGTIVVRGSGERGFDQWDAFFDPYNNLVGHIVVGSLNAHSRPTSYGQRGTNLWVSAFSGEAGLQSEPTSLDPDIRPADHYFTPAHVTTDISSEDTPCEYGFSRMPQQRPAAPGPLDPRLEWLNSGDSSGFDLGWHPLNQDCFFTATFHGSWAGASVVAATVAQMLEVQPLLNWREVKHILAATAKPIDTNAGDQLTTISGQSFTRYRGWQENGAGFWYHRDYGFGLVQPSQAVAMARLGNVLSIGDFSDTGWQTMRRLNGPLPVNSAEGLIGVYRPRTPMRVESVQLRLNLSVNDSSHLSIKIISPSGTEMTLLPLGGARGVTRLDNYVALANGFYGELSSGNWTVWIVDGKFSENPAQVNQVEIRFTGSAIEAEDR